MNNWYLHVILLIAASAAGFGISAILYNIKIQRLQREINLSEIRLKSFLHQFSTHDLLNVINVLGAGILKKTADESYDMLAIFARELRHSLHYTDKLLANLYEETEKAADMIRKEINLRELDIQLVYPIADKNDKDIQVPRMLIYSITAAHLRYLSQFGKTSSYLHINYQVADDKLHLEIKSGIIHVPVMEIPPMPSSLGGKLMPLYLNLFEDRPKALHFSESLFQRKSEGIENISCLDWHSKWSHMLISDN
ncbi:MAG: hypothetical protein Q7J34_01950 [Bacteroidales bacterium]|jgi:hypothetical protein|nr:hypothetical protein [Bacteroidales bacterium]